MTTAVVTVSVRGEQRIKSGHPWVYRSDVVEARADAGEQVVVRTPRGRTLGVAFYSDRSQIALRMLATGDVGVDPSRIAQRLAQALQFRESLKIDATAYRLVHGEADLLPSL